jgi:aminoglycoside phosphotransferase (APT) family kinase protein
MSDRPWTAEHPVDARLARELVAAQFPALDRDPVAVGQGWDMDVWRFGDLAFRFPRRPMAVGLVATELRVLPWLAAHLPLPIPCPTHVGAPSSRFPYPFYGHPFLGGVTADRAAVDRIALAAPLGTFLKALHALDPTDRGVPVDDLRGFPALAAQRCLPRAAGTPWEAELRVRLASPPPNPSTPPCVVHGDLYGRHLLVDAGALVGVIDWGDVCLGDRALDLAIVATFLPPEARGAFESAYGPVDGGTWARACFYGMCKYGLALYRYAKDIGDETLARVAAQGVEQTLRAS